MYFSIVMTLKIKGYPTARILFSPKKYVISVRSVSYNVFTIVKSENTRDTKEIK